MTKESRRDPRRNFAPRILPWLLAALMLGVYGLSLNHWISLLNINYVAEVSGWEWRPDARAPLVFLATYPLRWLPTGDIPLALNLFSAVCSALTLGLLARTVAILPQDRTEAQRVREHSDFSFLTTNTAWLPPLLAVLVCGLQFTFWQNATNFTGESFDLLIFAFVVWAIVEFRMDERENRLLVAMFLYGADMAENFAMIGFLPVLVAALIWIRGLAFFNLRFLLRLLVAWAIGGLAYFLLPTVAVFSGAAPESSWWQLLRFNLASEYQVFKYFLKDVDGCRNNLYLVSMTTLLPVLVMAFRWKSSFGDRSPLGSLVTGWMVHAVYAVMLYIGIWGMFDPPFAAHHLLPRWPFSTFYYLVAISVGYFSGYFLLISKMASSRSSRRRKSALAELPKTINPITIIIVGILTVAAAAGLLYKNLPSIRSINGNELKTYARLLVSHLPRTGGILLADQEVGTPRRLYFVQEELAQEGRANEFVPVDTTALNWPQYHRYLHQKYPKWPLLVSQKSEKSLNPAGLLSCMNLLAQSNNIFYLHPSFGYYFEVFYPEAHGLVYQLKLLPKDTVLPPRASEALIAENEAFWREAEPAAFGPILAEVAAKASFDPNSGLAQRIMHKLHVTQEPNVGAQLTGLYYSRALDFWGVQAQRAHELPQAEQHFEKALQLNPDNTVAAFNLQFNHDLQAGRTVPVDLSKTTPDHYGAKFRSWDTLININGPFDDPSFCYQDGNLFMRFGWPVQAIGSFARTRELEPDFLPALLSLGEAYDLLDKPAMALEAMKEPLEHPQTFSLNGQNSTAVSVIAAAAYFESTNPASAAALLDREAATHPEDSMLQTAVTHAYLVHGLYTNALRIIQREIATATNDPTWLFNLGYAHMRLGQDQEAIAAFTKVLAVNPDNHEATLNRAVAYLNTGQLDASRADYAKLQKFFPNSYQIAYGLGDIAWRRHDTNEATRNFGVYLEHAPTNSVEYKMVRQRLADLKNPAR